jgi:hypothetical protein
VGRERAGGDGDRGVERAERDEGRSICHAPTVLPSRCRNSASVRRGLCSRRPLGTQPVMSNIAELDKKLNDAVLSGKALDAFEELYDEDIVMQENSEPEFRGKDLNRKREQEFFASVEAWHSGAVLASAVNGDVSFSEWTMEVTLKGVGRIKLDQVAVRRWKNGKVVHERFYHK